MGSTVLGIPTVRMPRVVECLPQRLVIDAEVTRHRVDPESLRRVLARSIALWTLARRGKHIAGIARIPLGHLVGKEKARGGV